MNAVMEAEAARMAEYEKRKTPVPVTEEEWDDALNVLPPVRWYTDRGAETFTVSEPVTETLFARYVRIGSKRWTMLADPSDSLQTMVQRIRRAEGGES